MVKIIGHRGARALASENSLAAIQAGIAAGVDGVEIDIRLTADKRLVLSHDASLERLWGVDEKVSDLSLSQARRLTDEQGDKIASLKEALLVVGKTPVIIECKGNGWAKPLAEIISAHPKRAQCTVIAFDHHELFTFGQYCPNVPIYGLERHNPFDALNDARFFGFDGIDIHYWILNPLVYWLARRHRLGIIVFTVNKPWAAKLIQILYPGISITTDVPHKMQFLRPKKLRVRRQRSRK